MRKMSFLLAAPMLGLRASPAEQRAGRFLRAPDGHEASDGGAAAPSVPPEGSTSSDVPPAPGAPKSTDQLYDEEFGGVLDTEEAPADEGQPKEEETPPEPEPEGTSEKEEKPEDFKALLEEERRARRKLEDDIRDLKAQKGKEPEKDDGKQPERSEGDAPNPDDYEYGEADSRFIADFARWNARQEFRAAQEEQQLKTELDGIESTWKTATESTEIAEEYPDFAEKVTQGAERGDWYCSPLMALAIKSSDVGPHVAYHLASNVEESKRIASLTPMEQAFEIGKLEGRVAAGRAAKGERVEEKPAPKVSSAPPPPAARSRGAGGQYQNEGDALYDKMLREFD